MPIFSINNKRVLFIHIPKTGGTSIENWLSNFGEMQFYQPGIPTFMKCTPQHLTFNDINILFGADYFDLIFAVVRNPYERLVSEYIFRTAGQLKTFKKRVDFSDWLMLHLTKAKQNKHHFDNHLRPQTDFVNEQMKVFKLENGLEEVIKYLKSALKIKSTKKIPQLNKSKAKKDLIWSVEVRNEVNQFYRNDFLQLQYELTTPKIKLPKTHRVPNTPKKIKQSN